VTKASLSRLMCGLLLIVLAAGTLPAQREVRASRDSVTVNLVDVDVRSAVQALSPHIDRPVIIGNIGATKVTVQAPHPVPKADIVRLLRSILESQNLELRLDTAGGVYRIEAKEVARAAALAVPSAQPAGVLELFVVHLQHARASEVAVTVNALYGHGSALGELGGNRGTLSQQLTAQQVPPGIPVAGGQAAGAAARSASLSGEVVIIPDARANSLLIRASRADYALIAAAVREIDVRPLQVMIEVIIAEVRKDRSLDFGVDADVEPHRVGGSPTSVSGSTTSGVGLSDFVLKIMRDGGSNAVLRAAASRGDVQIVSRPVVIVTNDEEAEINVGSQRPFVQVARVLPTDNTARDQVVQYKDVGTRLKVRPTISSDGDVMLEVVQEVNAATDEQAFDAPVISTRSLQTKLLVRDSQTVVIGGLTDRQLDHNQGGIPVLSSIPLIGGLFGHYSSRQTETELFLFLTPHIIRNAGDAANVSDPIRARSRKTTGDGAP
jgi:general secretion pathway protein D